MKLKGRKIVGGKAEGELIVSQKPLSFLGGVDPETGIVTDAESDIRGESIAGKILAFPRGKGSTVGSYVIYALKKNGKAPKAIIVGEAETIIRDRQHLADDGVVIVTLGINFSTGEILFGPDVDSHGLTKDFDDMRDVITERLIASIATLDVPVDPDILRRRVRNTATRAIKKMAGRRPVVLPVVIEV